MPMGSLKPVGISTSGKTLMTINSASIACSACGARPWPASVEIRQSFDLRRYGPDGLPSESPAPDQWRCEEHGPERSPISKSRSPRAAPREAVIETRARV